MNNPPANGRGTQDATLLADNSAIGGGGMPATPRNGWSTPPESSSPPLPATLDAPLSADGKTTPPAGALDSDSDDYWPALLEGTNQQLDSGNGANWQPNGISDCYGLEGQDGGTNERWEGYPGDALDREERPAVSPPADTSHPLGDTLDSDDEGLTIGSPRNSEERQTDGANGRLDSPPLSDTLDSDEEGLTVLEDGSPRNTLDSEEKQTDGANGILDSLPLSDTLDSDEEWPSFPGGSKDSFSLCGCAPEDSHVTPEDTRMDCSELEHT